jgi:hypothetical protein
MVPSAKYKLRISLDEAFNKNVFNEKLCWLGNLT